MLIGISENLAGCRTRQTQPPAIGAGDGTPSPPSHVFSVLDATSAFDYRPIEEDT